MALSNDDAKYQHPNYIDELPCWTQQRDAIEGQEAIKGRAETYLPRISPFQSEAEYIAYLSRAMFYNATGRTVDGLKGAMFRKPPAVTLPAGLEVLKDDIDGQGMPLEVLCNRTAAEILSVGRFLILVDMPELTGPRPEVKLLPYCPESVWDWRVQNKRLVYLVLHEIIDQPGDGGFGHAMTEQLLVLRLDGGVYTAQRYEKRKVPGTDGQGETMKFVSITEPTAPQVRGKSLDFIPAICFAPADLTFDVAKSPISDLVDVNISHYKTVADYEHGCHYTALPTPVVSGLNEDHKGPLPLGPTEAWKLPQGAEAKMLEFTGKGLETLEKSLDRKERLMVVLGARLLEDQKKQTEAADTHRLRHSGENSILASIADTASRGITKALQIAAEWMAVTGDVIVTINKDFFDQPFDGPMLDSLLKAWMSGAISHETYLYNLQESELLPPDSTVNDEMDKIASEAPTIADMKASQAAAQLGGGGP
jgi:hypothetical protein